MNERVKKILRKAKDFFVIILSWDYVYVTRDCDYQGKCPECGFDHSQPGIERYSTSGGRCKFLGIFGTNIDFASTKCSSPKCQRLIKWYRRAGEKECAQVA